MKQFIDRWTKPCMFTLEVHSALPPPEFFRLWQCLCFLANWGAVCTAQYKNRYNTVCSDKYKYKRPAVCAAKYNLFAISVHQAQHAVLIGTGIGVTPYASILQSIMHRWFEVHLAPVALSLASLSIVILSQMPSYWYWSINISCRYWAARNTCPKCSYRWTNDLSSQVPPSYQPRETFVSLRCHLFGDNLRGEFCHLLKMVWNGFNTKVMNLRKVDFFWINREQRSFEWWAFPRNIKSSGWPKSKSLRSQKQ